MSRTRSLRSQTTAVLFGYSYICETDQDAYIGKSNENPAGKISLNLMHDFGCGLKVLDHLKRFNSGRIRISREKVHLVALCIISV